MSSGAAFLDRDGTIIEDTGFLRDPADVRLLDGAARALGGLRAAGLRLVVVSNQSGIGRGLITAEEAQEVHARFVDELGRHGVALDDARYCPHHPDAGCECRKPKPGMILSAASELGIELASSVMIGDRQTDVAAGEAAGVEALLFDANGGEAQGWERVLSAVAGGRRR